MKTFMNMNTVGTLLRTPCSLFAQILLITICSFSQASPMGTIAQRATPTILESGPDYRSWQRLEPPPGDASGNGHMVELATGMNYWDGTNWITSIPQFQVNPQDMSFIADKVQHP